MNNSYIETLIKNKENEKQERLRKKQFRHDWMIAVFSTIGGAVAGFITSLIFWLLSK